MNVRTFSAALGATLLLGSCVPAGGNFQGGNLGNVGFGTAGRGGPSVQYPVATADEIVRFVSGASAYIETYCDYGLCELECGYFAPNGSYESFAYETDPNGAYSYDWWYEFYGSWTARDGELCIDGSWDDGTAGPGCMLTEWNTTDDALLLIDNRDVVVASIVASSGSALYEYECDL